MVLGCALGQAGQFWGSAVRFGKRNPTGFCKQHCLCAARRDDFFQQIGQCFPAIGDPSCIWLQGPEVKVLSVEPFH